MFPTISMKEQLAYMNGRTLGGNLIINPNGRLTRRPLAASSKEDIDGTFHAAGAGCFAKPAEYCPITAILLNDGTHPTTGNEILTPETLWKCLPTSSRDARFRASGDRATKAGIVPPKPESSNPLPDLYPQPRDQAQGCGLSFFLNVHPSATGRAAGKAWWAGLPNLY